MSTDNPCDKEFKGLPCADVARHVCVKLATDSCSRDAIAIRACVDGVLSSTETIYETDGVTPLVGYGPGNIVQCPQEVRFCTSAGTEGGGAGGGDATAANQVLQLAQETAIKTAVVASSLALGAFDDSAAPTDTGDAGLVSLFKRHLQRWTTFFTLLPASIGQKAMAGSLAVTVASDQSRMAVDCLGRPTAARQLAFAATSAATDLTSGITRISIVARTADCRFKVGTTADTGLAATTTDHLCMQNERLDINVVSPARIAVIRDAAVSGTLELTELI